MDCLAALSARDFAVVVSITMKVRISHSRALKILLKPKTANNKVMKKKNERSIGMSIKEA